MEELLLELLIRPEAIGERDESLFDAVVREKMGEPVFHGFLKPEPGYVLPDDYEMPAAEDRSIRDALGAYVEEAGTLAKALGIESLHGRLAALEDLDVRTKQENDYDDFFGWMNPDMFDDAGNVRSQP